MMDQDHPMSPRERRVTAICMVVAVVIGGLLFGGYLPGLHPHYGAPEYLTVEGRSYYWTSIDVPLPTLGANYSAPFSTVLHNVTFWYWITNWSVLATTVLNGNATLPNDTTYAFTVGGGSLLVPPTTQYIAPGGEVAVFWNGGYQADLLVLA